MLNPQDAEFERLCETILIPKVEVLLRQRIRSVVRLLELTAREVADINKRLAHRKRTGRR